MEFVDARTEAGAGQVRAAFRAVGDARCDADLSRQTQEILEQVRVRGDDAVLEYTRRFDGFDVSAPSELEVGPPRLRRALESVGADLRQALEVAQERIGEYASRQLLSDWEYQDANGMVLGQRVSALDRVGLYVPGGTAAYPSSVLMGAVPARVAGVGEIVMTTPASKGQVSDEVLAAAALAGVDRVFMIGGAQAIAALTWGTQTVPAADKICGPGNIWVAEAKRQVYGRVGIDMIAGPSEIAIVADSSARPDWLAADLLAQAEHDVCARAILISCDQNLLSACTEQLEVQLAQLDRADLARRAIADNGKMILVSDLEQAAGLINDLAPEHLQLVVDEPDGILSAIRHAGAVFIGAWTAEVFSDYCAGPNHILPTMRCARFSSPLGASAFQKHSTVLRASRRAASAIAAPTLTLARAEGLSAHARAVDIRVNSGDEKI